MKLEKYELQFIETERESKDTSTEMFQKMFSTKDESRQKEEITNILNSINDNFVSGEASGSSKYMSALILRDLIESSFNPQTKVSRFFNQLLVHKIMKTL